MSYDYSYDNNGNITEIKQNGKLTNKYVYDSLNELKEEYDYVNKFYINYSYDGAGNLQNKYEQVLDPTYGYPTGTQNGNTYEYTDTSWKDKLTKVNGSNISYDANGNPLSYHDGMSFEWENGRILKNINTSDKAVQMSYDSNGMRTQKSVDGVKTNYYYDSNKNLIALVKGNDTLLFYYDSDGSATSFSYNGTMYFYVKNLQGDVIRIIDLAGTEVASYVYDAWGNIKDTKGEPTIREINPIRYRGYVYDTETSLYYLQSRYYDPFTGRFLNADIYCDTNTGTPLSTNMFSYCENNPVLNIDKSGKFGTPLQWAMAVIGGVAGWFLGDYVAKKLGYSWGWKYWAIRVGVVVGGAVIGWFAGKAIVKIVVKFLKTHPKIMSKIPNGVRWFLGIKKSWNKAMFQNSAKLGQHFRKHAKEWGSKYRSQNQYLNGARKLLNSSGKNIHEFTSRNGWYFKYNSKTNEFICVSDKGTISSYFRPREGIRYWRSQVKKYK